MEGNRFKCFLHKTRKTSLKHNEYTAEYQSNRMYSSMLILTLARTYFKQNHHYLATVWESRVWLNLEKSCKRIWNSFLQLRSNTNHHQSGYVCPNYLTSITFLSPHQTLYKATSLVTSKSTIFLLDLSPSTPSNYNTISYFII